MLPSARPSCQGSESFQGTRRAEPLAREFLGYRIRGDGDNESLALEYQIPCASVAVSAA